MVVTNEDLKNLIDSNELRGQEYRTAIREWLFVLEAKITEGNKIGQDTNEKATKTNGRVNAHDDILKKLYERQDKQQIVIDILVAAANFKKGGLWVVGGVLTAISTIGAAIWFLIKHFLNIH